MKNVNSFISLYELTMNFMVLYLIEYFCVLVANVTHTLLFIAKRDPEGRFNLFWQKGAE